MPTKHLLPSKLRLWIRRQLRESGYNIVHFPRLHLLKHHGVNLLLDVGASEGLYSEEMRQLGFEGRIVSFEPRRAGFARLAERASSDAKWDAVPFALGSTSGTSVIHISGSADSSSLLGMMDRHAEADPTTPYVGEETIEVRRLDDVFDQYWRPGDVPFLKLDVQGYEKHAIEGAAGVLDRIVGVQMELSLVPLYQGEALFAEMVQELDALGFTLMALEPGMQDPISRQSLQVDAIFFRPGAA